MDDDVRLLRSRGYRAVDENIPSDAPSRSPASSVTPQIFNFGPMADAASRSKDDLHMQESLDVPGSDEEVMLRQLRRQSTPYAFIPPMKTETKVETNHEASAMPGSFPDLETSQEDMKSKQEDVKPKPEPTPTETFVDDRTCRICFSPEAPDDKLISPCKCRGTSKWIHLSCLNQWRTQSQNSKSYYRCDQCHYEYSFRRTDLAHILASRYTLLALTFMAFTFAAFVGGFFIKFGLWLMPPEYLLGQSGWTSSFSFFYTPFDAGTDMLSAASALIPSTPRTWRDIFVIDIWHFLQGLVSLGIIGIVGFMGTGGLFSLRTFHPRRTRRQGDNLGMAELAFIVVILLGCGKVAFSMWKRVRDLVKQKLSSLGERILEVDPDQL